MDTASLINQVKKLSAEFVLDVVQKGDNPPAFLFRENRSLRECRFPCTQLDKCPRNLGLKKLPKWHLEVDLSEVYIRKQISESIKVMETRDLWILPNAFLAGNQHRYMQTNLEMEKNDLNEPMLFEAKHIYQLIENNTDAYEFILNVSNDGLMCIKSESETCDCEYYIEPEYIGEKGTVEEQTKEAIKAWSYEPLPTQSIKDMFPKPNKDTDTFEVVDDTSTVEDYTDELVKKKSKKKTKKEPAEWAKYRRQHEVKK